MPRFTVIYRTGGTAVWAWHRSLAVFDNYADAKELADEVERAGRRAIVQEVGHVELPETWDASQSVEHVRNFYFEDRIEGRSA